MLHGGSDVWPGSYGEEPLKPEWSGDRIRDEYEIALLRAFIDAGKPVLGVCRGLQVINVAFGGTLYQDITTQQPGSLTHRDAALYDQNFHEIELVSGTRLAALYRESRAPRVNSVHHQGVKKLADGFTVEATSPDDGMVEAMRWTGGSYVNAVQWHPEFHDWKSSRDVVGRPHPERFSQCVRERKQGELMSEANMLTVRQSRQRRDHRRAAAGQRAIDCGQVPRRARGAAGMGGQPLQARIDTLRGFRDALVSRRRAAGSRPHIGNRQTDSAGEKRDQRRCPRASIFSSSHAADDRARATCTTQRGMREQISHEPLGVIANISAWNYPYFVGGNVFVPALLTGNAVLYKPSEFAALTGIEIGKLLQRCRCSRSDIHGSGRRWRRRRRVDQAADRRRVLYGLVCDRPAHRTRTRAAHGEAAARARRQGSNLRARGCRRGKRRGVARRRRDVQHRAKLLLGRAHLRASNNLRRLRQRVRQGGRRASRSASRPPKTTYIGPLTRAPQIEVLERQVADAIAKGAKLVLGGSSRCSRPATGSRRRC